MPVIDSIRHCLAYNEILKDDGMMLYSPWIATSPHLNIVEFPLSGPLASVVRSEQKQINNISAYEFHTFHSFFQL